MSAALNYSHLRRNIFASLLLLCIAACATSHVQSAVKPSSPFDDWLEMQQVAWTRIDPTSRVAECCMWSIERYTRQYPNPIRNVRAVLLDHDLL